MKKLRKRILSLITAAAVAFSAVALPDTGILPGLSVTASAEGTTVDLSTLADNYTAQDNNVLTGTTSHTVTIANNANITLNNATITGGIVCEGSAEITLVGENDVKATSLANDLIYQTPGIKIGGTGTTLTIKGDGSLSATGGSAAAGIGLGRTWYANATGGSVVIESGNITASGDIGIGIGTVGNSNTASLDGIIIKGGTVNASLGNGYIYNGSSVTISAIKIYDTIDKVDASKITASVTYMHVDNETETDVTASASTYFTIIEDGDRRIIEKKDNTDYTITIADNSENGTIACAATTAKYGDKVTITATPNFGYRLSRLVVKDAQNNDVESTGNSFFMPKSNVTVSAVFEQGTHGTTEFAWGDFDPTGFVREASIYDGLTTVNLQQGQSCQIFKYDNAYSYRKFLLDNNISNVTIPYSGGTGTFPEYGNGTNFKVDYNGEEGFYDITMTDVGNGKWSVSIQKTVPAMDDVPDQEYTGSEITPEPQVMAGSLSLTKGTDYDYSYTNNTNAGTAKVTVTFKGTYASLGSVEKEFNIVRAKPNVTAVTGITLNKTSTTLTVGSSETLTATVLPADATDKTVIWTTSDLNVAVVANGVVTATGAGTATITAAAGDKTATCIVTVRSSGGGNNGGGSYTPVFPYYPTGGSTTTTTTTTNTSEPKVEGGSGVSGWGNIASEIGKTPSGGTVTVDMNGTTTVPTNVLNTLKGKDIDLVLDMGGGITWTINGKDIESVSGSIDLGVKLGTSDIPVDVVNNVTGEHYSTTIHLNHSGKFGFKAVMTVPLRKQDVGLFANLFYYNPLKKALEFVSSAKIDKNGNAELDFNHASDYAIIIDDHPMDKDNGMSATPTATGLRLAWNPVDGVTSYNVYVKKNGKYKKLITTTKTALNVGNLKNGTTYEFMVRYKIDGKLSEIAESYTLTVDANFKPVVTLKANEGSISVKWDKIEGATKYQIFKYANGKLKLLGETTGNSIRLTGTKAGKKYTIAVKALVNGKWTTVTKSDLVSIKAQ